MRSRATTPRDRVRPSREGLTDSLERFLESPLLLSAQGLALTPDERSLYLADYSRGMLKIDVVSRTATLLPCRDRVLALDAEGDSLIGSEVLERLHPRHAEPTLGVLVGRELFYIANSQWEKFGETGTVARPDQLLPPAVLTLRL